jgi:3-(3-hydroxy-phenyl)propionate hydroxylase
MSHPRSVIPAPNYDVAIVGLGPVGATLANLLGMQGARVLVLEREGEAYPLPRAVHFDDECMRVFQTIGVADELVPIVSPSKGMRYIDPGGNILIESPTSQELTYHGWHHGYRFHQPELEAILVNGLKRWSNVEVKRRSDVFALDQDEQGVSIRFEDLSSGRLLGVQAGFVVGCDGARSTVRRFIGSELVDLGFHERWLVVDLLLKVPRPDLGEYSIQHCDPVRSATYVCGNGSRRRWEIRLHSDESSHEMMQPARVWELLAKWLAPDEAHLERQAVYTFHSAIAERWRAGRLFLAGDSAHQTPPFLGQGMCAGIRDASNLAWKMEAVSRGRANIALLDTYQQERASHVQEYIELAVRLGGVINTTSANPELPNALKVGNNPIRLDRSKPLLGRGFAFGASELIGKQVPQPRLWNGQRLDDGIGLSFCLLVRDDYTEPWGTDVADILRRHRIRVIRDSSPALQDWLAQTGHVAVLVRPDRYAFGGADDDAQLSVLLAAALEQLLPRELAVASEQICNLERLV